MVLPTAFKPYFPKAEIYKPEDDKWLSNDSVSSSNSDYKGLCSFS